MVLMTTAEIKSESLGMNDETLIRTARFELNVAPVGVIQVIHGFGEHIGCYSETAEFFVQNNYACVIHDQRGFGKRCHMSEKERNRNNGIVSNYEYFLDDINAIRKKIDLWYPQIPVLLYGHSMGGNIAANYLLKRSQDQFEKAVLETPWLRLYKPIPDVATALAGFLGKINYKLAATKAISFNDITRNKDTISKLQNDKYYHSRMSFLLFSQITCAGEYAIKNVAGISIPTLVLCAGEDKIVCPHAIREFADNAGENLMLKEYPDGYHSLHSDLCKTEIFDTIISFYNGA